VAGATRAVMPVDVQGRLRAAALAALFGAAGAVVYEVQLLLPRALRDGARVGTASSWSAFGGTIAARRLERTVLESDDGRAVAIGAGTAPAVLVLGYTRCADRCPLTLAALSRALRETPRARRVRAFFLTTDPVHDTPAVLRRYLGAWDHAVTGVTAAPGVVRDVEARVGAGSGTREDHDTRLFVIGASGDVLAELPAESSVAELRVALPAAR
jgi:cytochrome oxidase Cu insertion factor (SCO1/SenC/PrrC family)